MRWVVPLVALCSAFACGYKYPVNGVNEKGEITHLTRFPNDRDDMVQLYAMSQLCYQTRHGVLVYHTRDSWCPARADIEAVFSRFNRTHSIDPQLWNELIVVVTSYNIDCGGLVTRGCADRAGFIMVTLRGLAFGGKYDWATDLAHELDHMDSFIASRLRVLDPPRQRTRVDGELD